jgi:hypothetical protein
VIGGAVGTGCVGWTGVADAEPPVAAGDGSGAVAAGAFTDGVLVPDDEDARSAK